MSDDDLPRLSKREWDALGSLLLPPSMGGKFTLRKTVAPKLEHLGLVEKFQQFLPAAPGDPPWMRVTIEGYRLTTQGHLLYCRWASTKKGGCDE